MAENSAPDELSQLLNEARADLEIKPLRPDQPADAPVRLIRPDPDVKPEPEIVVEETPEPAAATSTDKEKTLTGISSAIEQATKSVSQPTTIEKESIKKNAQGLQIFETTTYSPAAEKAEIARREQNRNRDERVLENLHRLENYVHNAPRIERERAERQNRATKMTETTELLGLGKEKAEAAARDLEEFERNNFPQELIRGEILIPSVDPLTNNQRTDFTETEINYRKNIDQWLEVAEAEQKKALEKIAEENKSPEQRAMEEKLARMQKELDAAKHLQQQEHDEKMALQKQLAEANNKVAENELAMEKIKQLAGEAYDEMVEQYEQRLAQAAQESREREAAIQTAQERRTGRALWWASAIAGGGVGIVSEGLGLGWWLNPILRGATTVGGLGFFAANMGAAAIERRRGAELEDRLGMFRNVARTARTVLSGFGAGIAAVSLSTMAIHGITQGVGAIAEHFTQQAPEKIATWVGEKAPETDWLSKLNVHKSAWGTVHDLINNHGVAGVELWQTPAGNNSADVIAQWSTEIFPHLNNSPVDIVQPGTLDLAKHLNADQIEFLKKLAGTKDYNHYLSLVKEYATTHPDIAKVPEVARVLARK